MLYVQATAGNTSWQADACSCLQQAYSFRHSLLLYLSLQTSPLPLPTSLCRNPSFHQPNRPHVVPQPYRCCSTASYETRQTFRSQQFAADRLQPEQPYLPDTCRMNTLLCLPPVSQMSILLPADNYLYRCDCDTVSCLSVPKDVQGALQPQYLLLQFPLHSHKAMNTHHAPNVL